MSVLLQEVSVAKVCRNVHRLPVNVLFTDWFLAAVCSLTSGF